MVNMGVLKAVGYTGSMMIGTIVLPYMFVGALAALAGIFISYSILPLLSEVLALQSGFSFRLHFEAKALVLIVVILLGVIFFFTYFI